MSREPRIPLLGVEEALKVAEREQLLEGVAAIGTWRLVSSVARSLEVPLEEGVEPWPPDGRGGG